MPADQMLASIDSALEDWERGPDVARWHADGGSRDELGPSLADLARAFEQAGAALTGLTRFAAGMQQMANAISRSLLPVGKFLNDFGHTVHRDRYPRKHIRCRRCNPRANPKPLTINGAAYRRRQRARKRRH